VAPHPLEDEAGFLDAIEATVARGGYSMLLPGSDGSLLAVSRHRERLEPYVRLGLPSHEVVERSLDKRALLESAERSGLPSPETIACSGAEEAFVAARALGFPVVIKPVRSIFEVDGVPRRSGSLLVSGDHELERVLHDYGDPCLLQRRERGTVLSYA